MSRLSRCCLAKGGLRGHGLNIFIKQWKIAYTLKGSLSKHDNSLKPNQIVPFGEKQLVEEIQEDAKNITMKEVFTKLSNIQKQILILKMWSHIHFQN